MRTERIEGGKTDSSERVQMGFDPQPDKFNYSDKAAFELLKGCN